jgi:argininosuccinate lyase
MSRMWDKGDPLDGQVLAYTAGEDHQLDNRLVPYDVRASIAHARMLHDRGLLPTEHLAAIEAGLQALADAHARGEWHIGLDEEDVHNALEHRLSLTAPEAAARLHLGRSRNDQVLTALRLYLKDAGQRLHDGALRVAAELDALAVRESDTPLPGYTHLQPAMPSSVRLWAEGFAAEIRDDAEGLLAACRRADRNPLGSAAGYGAPGLPLDREHTRRGLGFASIHEPVTAVQLSRGKAEAQLVFVRSPATSRCSRSRPRTPSSTPTGSRPACRRCSRNTRSTTACRCTRPGAPLRCRRTSPTACARRQARWS